MPVVLDANVFISAALSGRGPSATLVRAARDGTLDVAVSIRLLAEIRDVLRRPRFRQFLTLAEVDELIEEIGLICEVKEDPEPGPPLLRDPDDDYLVYFARAVDADYIVSGDADLTDAGLEPPALTPRQAVENLGLS